MTYIPRHVDGTFGEALQSKIANFRLENPKRYVTTWFFRKILKENGTLVFDTDTMHGEVTVYSDAILSADGEKLQSVSVQLSQDHSIRFKLLKGRDASDYVAVE